MTMQATRDALAWVWSLSDGQYVFLPRQNRSGVLPVWDEGNAYHRAVALPKLTTDTQGQEDWYFSTLSFMEPKRTLASASQTQRLVWADLDHLPNGEYRAQEHIPEPNLLWSTSPGHFQAVWQLTRPMTSELYQQVGPQFTNLVVGADKGGWSSTKVLRVPGSVNWKRGGVGGTYPIMFNWDRALDIEALLLSSPARVRPDRSTTPPLPTEQESHQLLVRLWPQLPLSARHVLTNDPLREDGWSRSEIVWDTAHSLARAGIDRKDAFTLIWNRPWNKFLHRPDALWFDINKAYNSTR